MEKEMVVKSWESNKTRNLILKKSHGIFLNDYLVKTIFLVILELPFSIVII